MIDVKKFDTEAIVECVNRYNSALSTLQSAYDSFQKSIDALNSDWTGRAFAAMSLKVADMAVNIKRSFDKIEDATSELTEVNGHIESVESSLKSKNDSIETGSASPFV